MPIYRFKCPECKDEIEELMKFDDPNPQCILCSAKVRGSSCHTKKVYMEKLFPTNTDFRLKGNGWSKDLYHKPNKK